MCARAYTRLGELADVVDKGGYELVLAGDDDLRQHGEVHGAAVAWGKAAIIRGSERVWMV